MGNAKKKMRVLSVVMSLLMILSVISFPTLKASAEGGVDGFVERCYTVTLDRGSDATGFADWKDQLLNGKSVGVNIAYGFLFSQEYKNKNKSNDAYVKDLYKLFMDREPDEAGFNDWVGKLNDGKSREEVFAGFANSQEFYNICESYGITAGYFAVGYDRNQVNNVNLFVERLYQTCLGRRGDRGGQKDWVNKLLKKEITGIECARCFIQSKEYINKGLSDEDYVENMYKAMMGRDSDAGGKSNWLQALSDGKTRDEVFAGFANSKEFGEICNNYKIEKGSYTAKDVSKPKEEQQETSKKYRKIRTDYNCGDYTLYEYKNNGSYATKETRYDKDGNVKGIEHMSQSSDDGLEYRYGYTGFDDNGKKTYSYFYKDVYSSDGKVETEYYYSDEFKTLEYYYIYEKETYKVTSSDGSEYTGTRTVKSTSYDANAKKTGYSTYEYDSNGKDVLHKSYDADGKLSNETRTEYYNKSNNSWLDRKTETSITYDSEGKEDFRYIYYYDGNANTTKYEYYYGGKLQSYIAYEYNSAGKKIKQTSCKSDGTVNYYYVYEYDSKGNQTKETDYDNQNAVMNYIINTYDSNSNVLSQKYYHANGVVYRSYLYEYNSNNQTTKYSYTSEEDTEYKTTTVSIYEYDQYGNQVKETRTVNGQEVFWAKTQYAEY